MEVSIRILHFDGLGMVSDRRLMVYDSKHLNDLNLLGQGDFVWSVVETMYEVDKAVGVYHRYKAPHGSQEDVGGFESILL